MIDDLRGGMFLACRDGAPSPAPTSQPSAQPTSAPSQFGAVVNSRDDGIVINKTKWPWGILVAILIGVCLMAVILGLIIYCCCWFCCFPVAIVDKKKKKKKKKEEEEDSTYTVHGPGGLIDEDGTVYGPEFLTTGSTVISESYDEDDEDVYEETTTIIKKKKGGKKGKKGADGPFKVYGYQGPLDPEGESSERSRREMEKNNTATSSSSSSSAAVYTTSTTTTHREDSDIVAAFKLSRQAEDRVFTKPKQQQAAEMAVIMERAEEVADIYEAKVQKDSFFENSGLSTDAYDYHPQQRSIQVSSTSSNVVTHTSSTTATVNVESSSSVRSDSSSVRDAKARLNAYKAKLHETTSTANTGNQTFASHKERMELEEKQREEENARLRAHMEQTRLMAEAQELANVAELARAAEIETYRKQIENARKHALEQEAAAKKANMSLMKAKAEEEAKQKFAALKAQRDLESTKRAEAELQQKNAEEAGRLRAEQELAEQQAKEAAAAVQQAVVEDEAQRAADKQRLKDEARIRAEEKAKARFLSFKAKAQSEAVSALTNPMEEAVNAQAVLAARAKLDAINAVLREKPPTHPDTVTEVITTNKSIVNETHNTTVTDNTVTTHLATKQKSLTLEFTADDMV